MTEQKIQQELSTFLVGRFPNLGNDLAADASLLDSGAVDSLGILEIVTFIGEQYGIELDDDDFQPDNFESLNALTTFIAGKKAA